MVSSYGVRFIFWPNCRDCSLWAVRRYPYDGWHWPPSKRPDLPRHPRLFVPHLPLHIVQRGHDRQPVFLQPADYEFYLSNLLETKLELDIRLLAYCLMTNHVHLILVPGDDVTGISKLVRVVAARHTRLVNRREGRTGTLWEGRFKASLIDFDRYLLACYRYVDLNPVRASMVATPEQYPWSSYRQLAALAYNRHLDSHDVYEALGEDPAQRGRVYRAFVARNVCDKELALIRTALRRNQLTGDRRFRQAIERQVGRRISARGPGRPPKGK